MLFLESIRRCSFFFRFLATSSRLTRVVYSSLQVFFYCVHSIKLHRKAQLLEFQIQSETVLFKRKIIRALAAKGTYQQDERNDAVKKTKAKKKDLKNFLIVPSSLEFPLEREVFLFRAHISL